MNNYNYNYSYNYNSYLYCAPYKLTEGAKHGLNVDFRHSVWCGEQKCFKLVQLVWLRINLVLWYLSCQIQRKCCYH